MSELVSSHRVLVTGGSGFIGSHLIQEITRRGWSAVNLDRARPSVESQVGHWRDIDLLDRAAVRSLIDEIQPTHIYNLAACADITAGAEAMLVNTAGCEAILSAAQAQRNPVHIIHASTQLVVRPGYDPQSMTDYAPYTTYGQSKADSEQIFQQSDYDAWTILRPTTVWGPLHSTFSKSIWRYIGLRLYMYPAGLDVVRSYGYIGNVVDQMLAVVERDSEITHRKVFYVGDRPEPTSRWLDSFSVALTNKPIQRVPFWLLKSAAALGDVSRACRGPAPINSDRLYRMTTDYAVPMEPTFAVLGEGAVSLDEGVQRTVGWLRGGLPFAPPPSP